MSLRTLLTLLVLAPLVVACATAPSLDTKKAPALVQAERQAQSLEAAGRHAEAAEAWQRLALRVDPPFSLVYRLNAADAWVLGGRNDQARRTLEQVDVERQPVRVQLQKALVEARLALAEERPDRALSILAPGYDPRQIPVEQQAAVHRLRAEAHARGKNYLDAIRERVILDTLLNDETLAFANDKEIWGLAGRLSMESLRAGRAGAPGVVPGWLELTAIARTTFADPPARSAGVRAWQARYPAHPATRRIAPALLDPHRWLIETQRIAVLLPREGPFAEAAGAVRDGILAGWFSESRAERPELRFYDATPDTAVAAHERAVEDGANVVLGPLDKDAVQRIARMTDLPVPTLVLNTLDAEAALGPAPPRSLIQFGLPPEEEAEQVARRARLDGFHRAALLHPDTDWGRRLERAYRDTWTREGGTWVRSRPYGSQDPELASVVQDFLATADGEKMDLVFLAAFPRQARQLNPLLQYHGVGGLSVYATSHVYPGIAGSRDDRELDGIRFVDMPWVLMPEISQPRVQRDLREHWDDLLVTYNRLFAFGFDAYRLSKQLHLLRSPEGLAGVSGQLRLDDANRVRRDLIWAHVEGGVPRLLAPPGGL